MKKQGLVYLVLVGLVMVFVLSSTAHAKVVNDWYDDDLLSGDEDADEISISDPLEPMNRVFFKVNDVLYYKVIRPVSRGYAAVLPADIRQCVDNFASNLATPIRLVNTLLQGRFVDSFTVLGRFFLNTTIGVAGLGDPAATEFGLERKTADFGQTLGVYGISEGFYLYWPLLGPSNLRDTAGLGGDYFLHPLTYSDMDVEARVAYNTGVYINKTSLIPDTYDSIKQSSLDPYVAIRHAYTGFRRNIISKQKTTNDEK